VRQTQATWRRTQADRCRLHAIIPEICLGCLLTCFDPQPPLSSPLSPDQYWTANW
jgi:hypothetical protein